MSSCGEACNAEYTPKSDSPMVDVQDFDRPENDSLKMDKNPDSVYENNEEFKELIPLSRKSSFKSNQPLLRTGYQHQLFQECSGGISKGNIHSSNLSANSHANTTSALAQKYFKSQSKHSKEDSGDTAVNTICNVMNIQNLVTDQHNSPPSTFSSTELSKYSSNPYSTYHYPSNQNSYHDSENYSKYQHLTQHSSDGSNTTAWAVNSNKNRNRYRNLSNDSMGTSHISYPFGEKISNSNRNNNISVPYHDRPVPPQRENTTSNRVNETQISNFVNPYFSCNSNIPSPHPAIDRNLSVKPTSTVDFIPLLTREKYHVFSEYPSLILEKSRFNNDNVAFLGYQQSQQQNMGYPAYHQSEDLTQQQKSLVIEPNQRSLPNNSNGFRPILSKPTQQLSQPSHLMIHNSDDALPIVSTISHSKDGTLAYDDGSIKMDYALFKMHLKLTPEGVACPICKYGAFGKLSRLVNHMDTHNQVRRFACTYCPLSFPRRHDLVRHIKGHEGIREFVCEKCGSAFKRKDTLKKHLLSRVHS